MDRSKFREYLDGDEELMKELASRLIKNLPSLVEALDRGILDGDVGAVEKAAHKIRGAVSSFFDPPASEAGEKLELAARAKAPLPELLPLIQTLKQAVDSLRLELDSVVTEGTRG